MSRQINCLPVEQFHRPPLIKNKRAEKNKKALISIRANNGNAVVVVVERNNRNVVVVVEGKQKKCSCGGGRGITIKIYRGW